MESYTCYQLIKELSSQVALLTNEIASLKQELRLSHNASTRSEEFVNDLVGQFLDQCKLSGMFTQAKVYLAPLYYKYSSTIVSTYGASHVVTSRKFTDFTREYLQKLGFAHTATKGQAKFAKLSECNVRECFNGKPYSEILTNSDAEVAYSRHSMILVNTNPTSVLHKLSHAFATSEELVSAISEIIANKKLSQKEFYAMSQADMETLLTPYLNRYPSKNPEFEPVSMYFKKKLSEGTFTQPHVPLSVLYADFIKYNPYSNYSQRGFANIIKLLVDNEGLTFNTQRRTPMSLALEECNVSEFFGGLGYKDSAKYSEERDLWLKKSTLVTNPHPTSTLYQLYQNVGAKKGEKIFNKFIEESSMSKQEILALTQNEFNELFNEYIEFTQSK